MTENNSKHIILMSFGTYKIYIRDYKLSRKARVSEISAFTSKRELCYMGYEHLQLSAAALIDKSRLSEIIFMLNGFMNSNSYSVVIDGVNVGNYILTDYEICGSEDDHIYKVTLTMCNSQ